MLVHVLNQSCCVCRSYQMNSCTALAVAMGLASLGLAATNMFGSRSSQSLYALAASTGLCAMSFVCLSRQLAKANLYMFLTQALYFSTSGASDYWMTADEDCVPGGPHFSYTYYSTFTSVVGSIFSIIGVALFQRTLSGWDFRPVFWVTTMIRVIASLVDIVMVKRWNVTVLGISDHVFYLLGDAIVYQVAYTLDFMPGVGALYHNDVATGHSMHVVLTQWTCSHSVSL